MWVEQRQMFTSEKRPEDLKPSGTLTIENNNAETGTFDAVIRNVVVSNGLKGSLGSNLVRQELAG